MNWAGTGLASFLAALLGALAGAITHYEARRHGIDFPPIVGVFAGLAVAFVSREKSGMRGIIVASIAVWAAAIAEVAAAPSNGGLVADILRFHERFGPLRLVLYLACIGAALVLASRSLRKRHTSEELPGP